VPSAQLASPPQDDVRLGQDRSQARAVVRRERPERDEGAEELGSHPRTIARIDEPPSTDAGTPSGWWPC
jgi:hypothetical protein